MDVSWPSAHTRCTPLALLSGWLPACCGPNLTRLGCCCCCRRRRTDVVAANVLSEQQCARALDLIWDFNEGMGTGVDRHDPSTWANENWVENATEVNGRASFGLGLANSEALWYVRSVPAVKKVWEVLEGIDDLIVSIDALCQFRPWGIEPSWRSSSGWFHTDRYEARSVIDDA